MTLDYLSVVCGWNLKQMVISFPLGIIQLLRFLCLFKFFFLFLAAYCFALICVLCVGRSSSVSAEGCWTLPGCLLTLLVALRAAGVASPYLRTKPE